MKFRKKQPEQRWRFVSDDDGHSYLIPADKQAQFEVWLEQYSEESLEDEDYEYEGEDFGKYNTNSPSNYTFTDPKED